MSDHDSRYSIDRPNKNYLHLVDGGAEYSTSDPGPVPEPSAPAREVSHDASSVIANAVMHAAMSWVACCMERQGVSVSVAALGGGVFDADVTLSDGGNVRGNVRGNVMVRVTLILEHGPRLRTLVEPIHP